MTQAPTQGFGAAPHCAELARYCPGQEGGAGVGRGWRRRRSPGAEGGGGGGGGAGSSCHRWGRAGQGGSARDVRARRPRHGARQSRHARSGLPPGPAAAAAAAVAATIAAASARAARRREPGRWEPRHGRGETRPGPGGWGKGRDPASGPPREHVQGRECSLSSQVAGPQAPLTALGIHEPRNPGPSSPSSVVPAPSRPPA